MLNPEFANFALALFAWTVLATLILLALSFRQRLHPVLKVGLIRATLLALPLGLAVASLNWIAFFPHSIPLIEVQPTRVNEFNAPPPVLPTQEEATPPILSKNAKAIRPRSAAETPPPSAAESGGWSDLLPAIWIGLGWVLIAFIFVQALRLAWDSYQLLRFRQSLKVEPLADYDEMMQALSQQVGLKAGRASLAVMQSETVPMTFGWRKPMIVLPKSLLVHPLETEMAILHELTHIRRHDYAWNWFERLCTVLFGFHPLVFLLQKQIERFREEICDTSVLSYGCYPADQYAGLLFRLSSVPTHRPALQMADTFMSLKTRLETMRTLVHSNQRIHEANRRAWGLGLVLLGFMTFAIAGSRFKTEPTSDVKNAAMPVCQIEDGDVLIQTKVETLTTRLKQKVEGECKLFLFKQSTGTLIRFSTRPFSGAMEAGQVMENMLSFSINGVAVSIASKKRITEVRRLPLFVRYESQTDTKTLKIFHLQNLGLVEDWVLGVELEARQERSLATAYNADAFNVVFAPHKVNDQDLNENNTIQTTSLKNSFLFFSSTEVRTLNKKRIIFSETPFRNAKQLGYIKGEVLTITHPEAKLIIECKQPIYKDRREQTVWVRIEPIRLFSGNGVTDNPDDIESLYERMIQGSQQENLLGQISQRMIQGNQQANLLGQTVQGTANLSSGLTATTGQNANVGAAVNHLQARLNGLQALYDQVNLADRQNTAHVSYSEAQLQRQKTQATELLAHAESLKSQCVAQLDNLKNDDQINGETLNQKRANLRSQLNALHNLQNHLNNLLNQYNQKLNGRTRQKTVGGAYSFYDPKPFSDSAKAYNKQPFVNGTTVYTFTTAPAQAQVYTDANGVTYQAYSSPSSKNQNVFYHTQGKGTSAGGHQGQTSWSSGTNNGQGAAWGAASGGAQNCTVQEIAPTCGTGASSPAQQNTSNTGLSTVKPQTTARGVTTSNGTKPANFPHNTAGKGQNRTINGLACTPVNLSGQCKE